MDMPKTTTLIHATKLQQRVTELGAQISRDYEGQPITIVGVLKGSFIFLADLVRAITAPVEIEFIGVSSYEAMNSTGQVRITNDLSQDISGKHVLLVEDIIDTGLTIDYLIKVFAVRKPKSLKICSLLSKPEAHQMTHNIDYVGFEISREFVIGYGLDLDGHFRNLPHIEQVHVEK
ncbi:MAG: hypoxanthine phosphoribosyltransferase [Oligoflexus sp.]